MNSLHLILILSAALHCKAEVDTNFTMIFASGKQVLLGKSNKLHNTKELANFEDKVTALAVNRDFLFVISGSDVPWPNSIMRRCKIVRSADGEITGLDKDSLSEFEWIFDKKVNTFVVVHGNIHFNGDTVICPGKNCSSYKGFDTNLTGIDYNPADNHLYASTRSGDLKSWQGLLKSTEDKSAYKRFNKVNFGFEGATALKVAFGKVWVGFYEKDIYTEKISAVLWRCSFNYTDGISKLGGVNCKHFNQYNELYGKIMSIGATHDYLYVFLERNVYMSRCDPNKIESCQDDINKPGGMTGPTVIDLLK